MNSKLGQEAKVKELAARFCARSRDEGPPLAMSKGFFHSSSSSSSSESPSSNLLPKLLVRAELCSARDTDIAATDPLKFFTAVEAQIDKEHASLENEISKQELQLYDRRNEMIRTVHQEALNRYILDDIHEKLQVAFSDGKKGKSRLTSHWSQWVMRNFYEPLMELVNDPEAEILKGEECPLIPYVRVKDDRPYLLLRTLGQGGFARVCEVLNIDTGVKFAAKFTQMMSTGISEIEKGSQADKWLLQSLLREIMTMKGETHPNLLLLHDHFTWNHPVTRAPGIVTILDLCAGDLSAFTSRKHSSSSASKRKKWVCDMLIGLDYLHAVRGILHMDIKAQNLLISSSAGGQLKIADLGLCREMVEADKGRLELAIDCSQEYSWVGTIINQPPEYLNALLTKKTDFVTDYRFDIWAAGLVAYTLLVHPKHPFAPQAVPAHILHDTPKVAELIYNKITQKLETWKLEIAGNMSEKMRFVLFMLGVDSRTTQGRRPTARECLEHPFLTEKC